MTSFWSGDSYGGRCSGQYTDEDLQAARAEGEKDLAFELWAYIEGYSAETERVQGQILRERRQKLLQDLRRIAGGKPENPGQVGARWPLHDTRMLTAMRQAAWKFWANFNPQETDTASTNATVVEWLKSQHGISTSTAECMATILRADGLKSGPRPKR